MIVSISTRASANIAAYPVVGTKANLEAADAPKKLLISQEDNLSLLATTEVRHRLRALSALPDNWDGHGSDKPNLDAITRAYREVMRMFRTASLSGYGWFNPAVSSDERGDVVFEWWRGPHKLTVYVAPDEMSYLRVWGDDIDAEMEDGSIDRIDYDFLPVWGWLNS